MGELIRMVGMVVVSGGVIWVIYRWLDERKRADLHREGIFFGMIQYLEKRDMERLESLMAQARQSHPRKPYKSRVWRETLVTLPRGVREWIGLTAVNHVHTLGPTRRRDQHAEDVGDMPGLAWTKDGKADWSGLKRDGYTKPD